MSIDKDYLDRYNNPEERLKRMLQEDPIAMYLVMHEIGMGPGKIAAQCGHAVNMLCIKRDEYIIEYKKSLTNNRFIELESQLKIWNDWQNNSFRKIVLTANDNKWAKLKEKLIELNIEHVLVVDSGLTQIPYGSETFLGLWPMHKSQAPQCIKKLQALK